MSARHGLICLAAAFGGGAAAPAQWVTAADQTYLPGAFNWAFDARYPDAAHLFYAFDYGHAILYETLFTRPSGDSARLEVRQFEYLTKSLLRHPPRLQLAERAIDPEYAKLVPEAQSMFDWAHLLHRQIYDVWSDDRLSPSAKDARVAELIHYYRARADLAFSTRPKSMELMEGQPYSLVFRSRYPRFNGLIWAYHWLQVGLYDALLAGPNPAARVANVRAAIAHFWAMLDDPPSRMPSMMPMTAAVAPRFTARYPDAAVIFDNLHSMHDVVSDILASPKIARSAKRAAILRAAARYRDDSSSVISTAEWLEMAASMGVEHMGGLAVP